MALRVRFSVDVLRLCLEVLLGLGKEKVAITYRGVGLPRELLQGKGDCSHEVVSNRVVVSTFFGLPIVLLFRFFGTFFIGPFNRLHRYLGYDKTFLCRFRWLLYYFSMRDLVLRLGSYRGSA